MILNIQNSLPIEERGIYDQEDRHRQCQRFSFLPGWWVHVYLLFFNL